MGETRHDANQLPGNPGGLSSKARVVLYPFGSHHALAELSVTDGDGLPEGVKAVPQEILKPRVVLRVFRVFIHYGRLSSVGYSSRAKGAKEHVPRGHGPCLPLILDKIE